MNILEGLRPSVRPNAKFVIKSKPKDTLRTDPADSDSPTATEADLEQFLVYMVARSKRFAELVGDSACDQFVTAHLHRSVCVKTILMTVLDKMLADRRLGKNLKGMNKSNLAEIETAIWPTLERELQLFRNEQDYLQQTSQLKLALATRKRDILAELTQLGMPNQPTHQAKGTTDCDGTH